MSNERLAAAVARGQQSIEQIAREVAVDPKSVQRSIAGRTPHPRHRYALAQLL